MHSTRTNVETAERQSRPYINVSSKWISVLAAVHISCWVASVVLGTVAIWLRLQSNTMFYGTFGLPIWASFPFAICGVLTIAVTKTQQRRTISWFMLTSVIAFFCAVVILIYSVIAIIAEGYSYARTVAIITTSVSFIESVASTMSVIIGYRAIGLKFKWVKKNKIKKEAKTYRPKNRIHPGDNQVDHVTVMALPPQDAVELFRSLYGRSGHAHPIFEPPMDGYDSFNQSQDVYRHPSSDGRRRRPPKRYSRQFTNRNDSSDYPIPVGSEVNQFEPSNLEVEPTQTVSINKTSPTKNGDETFPKQLAHEKRHET